MFQPAATIISRSIRAELTNRCHQLHVPNFRLGKAWAEQDQKWARNAILNVTVDTCLCNSRRALKPTRGGAGGCTHHPRSPGEPAAQIERNGDGVVRG